MRLFEWMVKVDGRAVVAPAGITDNEFRARHHVLDSLAALPGSSSGRGWIAIVSQPGSFGSYERRHCYLYAERLPSGVVRWPDFI
jgi:hypothetical protein